MPTAASCPASPRSLSRRPCSSSWSASLPSSGTWAPAVGCGPVHRAVRALAARRGDRAQRGQRAAERPADHRHRVGDHHRGGGAGGSAAGRDRQPGLQHEEDVPRQDRGAQAGRLRDDGQRHHHLQRQDRHADAEPHDRQPDLPLCGRMWPDSTLPQSTELSAATRKLLIEAVAINSKAWGVGR